MRIDPQANELQERIPIDFIGANLTAGAGSVWVAPAARDSGSPTGNDGIARISEEKKQILETIHVGDGPASWPDSWPAWLPVLWDLVTEGRTAIDHERNPNSEFPH